MFQKKIKKSASTGIPKEKTFIQSRLNVGKPGDKYEVEADKMADQVVNKNTSETSIQKKEGDEEVQQKPLASSITPLVQKKQNTEEESVQNKQELQRKEDEEAVQQKEDEEAVQKMEDEEVMQQKEDEESVQTKSNNQNTVNPSIEGRLKKGSGGTKMDNQTKNEMESGFGADFSNVNIHNDNEAAQMSQDIGAQAFTHGNDVYFNQGKYNPDSKEGKHLLAHELTHTVQQKGMVQQKIQKQNSSPNVATMTDVELRTEIDRIERELSDQNESNNATHELQTTLNLLRTEEGERIRLAPQLNAITARYRSMILDARSQGYHVAANNLEHFLTGNGTDRILGVSWLRRFSEIISAEQTNQNRFQDAIHNLAISMSNGETRRFSDFWDRSLTGGITTELYYASGTSTITSRGTFTLSKVNDSVTISGEVNHRWWDPYDWHQGLNAFIPGHGSISDTDALLLQRYRQASPFLMESNWTQNLNGTILVQNWLPDTVNLNWTGP